MGCGSGAGCAPRASVTGGVLAPYPPASASDLGLAGVAAVRRPDRRTAPGLCAAVPQFHDSRIPADQL